MILPKPPIGRKLKTYKFQLSYANIFKENILIVKKKIKAKKTEKRCGKGKVVASMIIANR